MKKVLYYLGFWALFFSSVFGFLLFGSIAFGFPSHIGELQLAQKIAVGICMVSQLISVSFGLSLLMSELYKYIYE